MQEMNEGPAHVYQKSLDAGEIKPDSAQAEAVIALQGLYERLLQPGAPKPSFFDRLLGRELPKRSVCGLFFWGGVGPRQDLVDGPVL